MTNKLISLIFLLSGTVLLWAGNPATDILSENSRIRQKAVTALGKKSDDHSVDLLIQALQDSVYEVKIAAIHSLGKTKNRRAIAPLLSFLDEYADWEEREAIQEAIQRIIGNTCPQELLDGAHHEKRNARELALEQIGKCKTKDAVSILFEAIHDSISGVREVALSALSTRKESWIADSLIAAIPSMGSDDRIIFTLREMNKVEPLLRNANHPNDTIRSGILHALQQMEDQRIEPIMLQALKDSYPTVRTQAVKGLNLWNNPKVTKPLLEMYNDTSAMVRRATIERINGWIDIPGSSPILIRALSDSDSEVRKQAAEFFSEKRDTVAILPMIALLADTATYHYKYYPYEYIREYAAKYLAEKGDQQAESPMMEALTDSSVYVQISAAQFMGRRKVAEAVIPLMDFLKSDDENIRSEGAQSLALIGDTRGLRALIPVLRDESREVRAAAASGLKTHPIVLEKADEYYLMIAACDREEVNTHWQEIRAQLIRDISNPSKVYYAVSALMWIGNASVIPQMIQIMNAQDGTLIPNTYLNSGNLELRKAAEIWCNKRGYYVESTNSGVNTLGSWGR
jgi:HEAT repeat protein